MSHKFNVGDTIVNPSNGVCATISAIESGIRYRYTDGHYDFIQVADKVYNLYQKAATASAAAVHNFQVGDVFEYTDPFVGVITETVQRTDGVHPFLYVMGSVLGHCSESWLLLNCRLIGGPTLIARQANAPSPTPPGNNTGHIYFNNTGFQLSIPPGYAVAPEFGQSMVSSMKEYKPHTCVAVDTGGMLVSYCKVCDKKAIWNRDLMQYDF